MRESFLLLWWVRWLVDRDISVRFFYVALVVVVLLAGVMRFGTLSTRSLDNDETITAFDIAGTSYFWLPRDADRPVDSYANEYHAVREAPLASWQLVIGMVQRNEEHPPLYFLLQGLWSRMFGMENGGLRSLSAFLGVVAVAALGYVALFITRRRKIALLAAVFLTISPLHIFYSQEARPYALLTLIAVGSIYCFARMERENSWQWAMWLGASYFVGVMTQYLFLLLPATQVFYCLVSRSGRKVLAKCAVAALGAVVLFLPWVPTAIYQLSNKATIATHNSAPMADRIRQGAYAFASYWCGMDMHLSRAVCLLAALVGWGAVVYWVFRQKERPFGASPLASVAVLPFVVPALAWVAWRFPDIWTRPKHYLLLMPAVAICLAWSLVSMRRWCALAVGLVVMVPMAISAVGYYPCLEHKSDVAGAAAFLSTALTDQDLLVTQGSCSQISYYTPGIPNRVHISKWTPELLAAYNHVALFTTEDPSTPSPDTTRTREWLAKGYVVDRRAKLYDATVEVYRRAGF